DARQPEVAGEAAVVRHDPVQHRLDVERPGPGAEGTVGDVEVEEPPVAAGPVVALVAEVPVGAPGGHVAGLVAGPADGLLEAVRLEARERDDLGVDDAVGGPGIVLADPELDVVVPVGRARQATDLERIDDDGRVRDVLDLDRQQRGRREVRRRQQRAGGAERRDAELDLREVRRSVRAVAGATLELPADRLVAVDADRLHGAAAVLRVGTPAVVDQAHVAEVDVLLGHVGRVADLAERNAGLIHPDARARGAGRAGRAAGARGGARGARGSTAARRTRRAR